MRSAGQEAPREEPLPQAQQEGGCSLHFPHLPPGAWCTSSAPPPSSTPRSASSRSTSSSTCAATRCATAACGKTAATSPTASSSSKSGCCSSTQVGLGGAGSWGALWGVGGTRCFLSITEALLSGSGPARRIQVCPSLGTARGRVEAGGAWVAPAPLRSLPLLAEPLQGHHVCSRPPQA